MCSLIEVSTFLYGKNSRAARVCIYFFHGKDLNILKHVRLLKS